MSTSAPDQPDPEISPADPEVSPSGAAAPGAAETLEREGATERIIAFTDAAVAIALTLLILPLMEAVAAATEGTESPAIGPWLAEHTDAITAFAMSFAMVAFYWTLHHRAMTRVRRFSGRMLVANFVWLLGIVVLPVAGAITVAFRADGLQVSVYIGSLLLIAAGLLWLQVEIHRDPGTGELAGDPARSLAVAIATVAALLLAWPIIVLTPLGYLGMFVMAIIGPLSRVIAGRLRRRTGAEAA